MIAVGDDDEDDAGDHRRGRRLADGRGAAAALHAAQAAGERDQHAEHGGFEQADPEVASGCTAPTVSLTYSIKRRCRAC